MREIKNVINRQKKGISVVITTLIIVVASVVLGTAVTLFATGLFGTSSGQTSISTSNVNVWYNGTTTDQTVGSAVIRNTGDRIAAISSISVSGTNVPFSNWFYNATGASSANIQKQFAYGNSITGTATLPLTGLSAGRLYTVWDLDRDGIGDLFSAGNGGACTVALANCALLQATGPISLNPGKAVIVYFSVPTGTLKSVDVGTTATVNISAGSVSSVQSISVAKAS